MRTRNIIVPALLALITVSLAGCGNPSQLWVQQNRDYHRSVVQPILLPHYINDPAVTPEEKANVSNATLEHERFLDDAESQVGGGGFLGIGGNGN